MVFFDWIVGIKLDLAYLVGQLKLRSTTRGFDFTFNISARFYSISRSAKWATNVLVAISLWQSIKYCNAVFIRISTTREARVTVSSPVEILIFCPAPINTFLVLLILGLTLDNKRLLLAFVLMAHLCLTFPPTGRCCLVLRLLFCARCLSILMPD